MLIVAGTGSLKECLPRLLRRGSSLAFHPCGGAARMKAAFSTGALLHALKPGAEILEFRVQRLTNALSEIEATVEHQIGNTQ